MEYQEDMNKLINFVNCIKKDIGFVIPHLYEINPELKKFDLPIEKAWDEVKPNFEKIIRNLEGKDLLDIKRLNEELLNRGLVGVQLELKLKLYEQQRHEFEEAWNDFKNISEEKKDKKKEKRGILSKVLGKLFRIIDRILESLGFVPGSDAIKEIKGILEEVLP